MKVPSSISKILINKNFLYIIAFLSLTNILGYMMLGHLSHIVVFIVVGLIMSYFSKNMAVILLVSLIASNSYHITFAREGFANVIVK